MIYKLWVFHIHTVYMASLRYPAVKDFLGLLGEYMVVLYTVSPLMAKQKKLTTNLVGGFNHLEKY